MSEVVGSRSLPPPFVGRGVLRAAAEGSWTGCVIGTAVSVWVIIEWQGSGVFFDPEVGVEFPGILLVLLILSPVFLIAAYLGALAGTVVAVLLTLLLLLVPQTLRWRLAASGPAWFGVTLLISTLPTLPLWDERPADASETVLLVLVWVLVTTSIAWRGPRVARALG